MLAITWLQHDNFMNRLSHAKKNRRGRADVRYLKTVTMDGHEEFFTGSVALLFVGENNPTIHHIAQKLPLQDLAVVHHQQLPFLQARKWKAANASAVVTSLDRKMRRSVLSLIYCYESPIDNEHWESSSCSTMRLQY